CTGAPCSSSPWRRAPSVRPNGCRSCSKTQASTYASPKPRPARPKDLAMRHAEEPEDDSMPGQDSFIDVICNMVGILITLVVVVGMRVPRMVMGPAAQVTPVVAKVESVRDVAKLRADLDEALRKRRDAADEVETAMSQAVDMRANAELVDA